MGATQAATLEMSALFLAAAPTATSGAHQPFAADARFFDDFATVIVLPNVILAPAPSAGELPQATATYYVLPPAEWAHLLGGTMACGAQMRALDDAIQRAAPLARLTLVRPIKEDDNNIEYTFDNVDAAIACRAAGLGLDDAMPRASEKVSLFLALADAYQPDDMRCYGGVLVHSNKCATYSAWDDSPWAMRLVNELLPPVVVAWATASLVPAVAAMAAPDRQLRGRPASSAAFMDMFATLLDRVE